MIVDVKGYVGVDVEQCYKEKKLNAYRSFIGDWSVKIIDGEETIYFTDFAGTHCQYTLPRNSTIVVKNNEIIFCKQNFDTTGRYYIPPYGWHKQTQYFNLWKAVDQSVHDRVHHLDPNKTILLLSSGHDSGVIACSLLRQNYNFKVISLRGEEESEILKKRCDLFSDSIIVDGWERGGGWDFLFNYLEEGYNIISGLGADELYTSEDFEILERFFSESNKLHQKNINTIYPLCDYRIWRQYWALEPKYIRGRHKAPLLKYMEQYDFPVYYGPKISFGISSK